MKHKNRKDRRREERRRERAGERKNRFKQFFSFNKKKSSLEADRENKKEYVGTISVNPRGFGFFMFEDTSQEDVFIAPSNLNGAYNGDKVKIVLFKNRGQKSREGVVVSILERGTRFIVGNFVEFKGGGFLEPDTIKIHKDIFIPQNSTMGAKNGEKVVVRITDYGSEAASPEGEVVEIIGDMTRKGDDIIAIIRNYELFEAFPIDVNEEAQKVAQEVSEVDKSGREDFRDKIVCTIDGGDARDFDDAISIEKNDQVYTLGVHIADVGHYVKRGSLLDKEAYNRGTSVYFPDMVLPMLPKELSNGICSLNPNVDRLTLSVVAKIDKNGDVIDYKICESVINSAFRMTYDDVYAILCGDEQKTKQFSSLAPSLLLMSELDTILTDKRKARGALDFDLPETIVKVDDAGKTIEIAKRERNKAHIIIESFMLLANEIIAKHFREKNLPFIYRVHEKPTFEKMKDFYSFASALGVDADVDDYSYVSPKDLQKVIAQARQTPYEKPISEVMLRSLQKAKYFQKCLGHFGLALKDYCHFTSPIRRYPDLCIHRIIKDSLHGDLDAKLVYELQDFVIDAANRSSERERLAEKAEREVVAYKKCEFMQGFIGEQFDAVVSGVNSNGVFVELENTVEGFINLSNLPLDNYTFDEKLYTLKGSKHKFMLGQTLRVQLDSVNLKDRRIDFTFVS